MKLLRFIILFTLLCNGSTKSQCWLQNTTFAAGEKLKYTVYYNFAFVWLEIADIEFTTSIVNYSGKNCIKILSTWKTRPKYNWIMNVDDVFEVIIDNDSIIPYDYNHKIKEDKYVSSLKYLYSKDRDFVYAWIENSKTGKKLDTIPVNNCIFDLITSIYYIRNIRYSEYKSNQKIPYSAIVDDRINKLEIKYVGRELIKAHNERSFECLKVKPSIASTDMFKGGDDKLTVWFSADDNQLPIMAESELFLGSVKVIIKSYMGLRYPSKF